MGSMSVAYAPFVPSSLSRHVYHDIVFVNYGNRQIVPIYPSYSKYNV